MRGSEGEPAAEFEPARLADLGAFSVGGVFGEIGISVSPAKGEC